MTESAVSIHVPGLTKLDELELGQDLAPTDIEFQAEGMDGTRHGELATTAIIAVSIVGLKVLASWLVKSRSRSTIKKTVEVVGADGTRRKETLEIDLSNSDAPEASVLAELGRLCSVDVAGLGGGGE